MRRTSLASVALATTLMVAGCGGSSAKPLTRAELSARANTICKTVTAKLATKTIKTEQDVARVAPELASFEQTALTELSKLVPPVELSDDWRKFVAGAETLAENTTKLGEYAKVNNLKAAGGLIASSQTIQHQMQAIARRDGFANCEQVA